jgi:Spy/CpxP family protein refolding chaperone
MVSAVFALSAASLRAQDATPPTPTPPGNSDTAPADGGQANHRHRRGWELADLTQKLNLTVDQQKTVGAIIADGRSQSKALREDQSIAQEDKRAKMQEIMGTTRAQIRAALTPDQQKLFDALPSRGERNGAPAAPAPTPAPTP